MACGCNKGVKEFVWTSEDGTETRKLRTEIEARAAVIRSRNSVGGTGGTWVAVR